LYSLVGTVHGKNSPPFGDFLFGGVHPLIFCNGIKFMGIDFQDLLHKKKLSRN